MPVTSVPYGFSICGDRIYYGSVEWGRIIPSVEYATDSTTVLEGKMDVRLQLRSVDPDAFRTSEDPNCGD